MLRLWKGLGTLTASGLGFRASGWGLVGFTDLVLMISARAVLMLSLINSSIKMMV